jgi:hypothetical protein
MWRAQRRSLSLLVAALSGAALSVGCTVYSPPGYAELTRAVEPEEIPATPLRMFGCAPWSYDLPDQSQALIRLDTGASLFDDAFSFRVSATGTSLRCDANAPDARLRCRGTGAKPVELSFGAAPRCAPSGVDARSFLSQASCWEGQVEIGDESFAFSYGTVSFGAAGSWPFNRATWFDPNGRPVQAYDGVVDMHVTLHRRTDIGASGVADALRASALALHFWNHTTYCDD